MLSSVDLPAPEGPMMVTNSPSLISSVDAAQDVGAAVAAFVKLLDVAKSNHDLSILYSCRSAMSGSSAMARRAGR